MTCLMDLGQDLGHDINIRKHEGDSTKVAFARKTGDTVFSVDRPGSLYVVPSTCVLLPEAQGLHR